MAVCIETKVRVRWFTNVQRNVRKIGNVIPSFDPYRSCRTTHKNISKSSGRPGELQQIEGLKMAEDLHNVLMTRTIYEG